MIGLTTVRILWELKMQIGEVRIINGKLSLITSGAPYPCNFWEWRDIRKNGTLGKTHGSYNDGSIEHSKPIKHEVVIRVNSFELLKVPE